MRQMTGTNAKHRMAGIMLLWLLTVSYGQAADATVAPNGDGQFKSIHDAIMAAPQGVPSAERPWVIAVKPGVYKELIYVQRERRFIRLVGEDAATTIITMNLHANLPGPDGKPIGTFRTPTVQVDGDGFGAENITFENSAVYSRVRIHQADKCVSISRSDVLFGGDEQAPKVKLAHRDSELDVFVYCFILDYNVREHLCALNAVGKKLGPAGRQACMYVIDNDIPFFLWRISKSLSK